jgi:DNA-damage-inducible protein J
MATINYTLRLDETDKASAEQIFNELGLTLAAGLNIYVKAVVRQQKIPFELSVARQTATDTWGELDKIVASMEEKPRLEDFPRTQFERELINFDEV